MSHPILKITLNNIVALWFGEDTPIRRYKAAMNPSLWAACEKIALEFTPPSGAVSTDKYRKSDYKAFARAVQQEMQEATLCC